MYPISDQGAAVMRIQRYLISVLQFDGVPLPPIDGVFGEDTGVAVLYFQEKMGLSPSGIVDEETFALLYQLHLEEQELSDTSDGVYRSAILRNGDHGEEVRRLNSYLAELYADERETFLWDGGDAFTKATEEAVRTLQKKWGERETGDADRAFRRRLTREVETRNRRNNRINTA